MKAVHVLIANNLGQIDIVGVYQNRKDAIDDRIRLELDIKHCDTVYMIQEYILK